MARLRSEIQTFNPLNETTQLTRNAVKVVNIAGMPLVVLLFGMCVWLIRSRRRRRIRQRFSAQ
jgi:cytochrome c-type biogenesis protein CcmH/NrfF